MGVLNRMSKNVVIQEYQNEVEIPVYISVSRVGKNLIKRMLKGKDVIKNRLSPSTQYGPNTFIAFSKNGEEYIFTNKKDFCEVSTFGNECY
ncbi:hypothetical protein TcarDRAFT_2739 [Thermosinus carboxydivorans Nor1]|uniref:Uncharacterized protein n=2 Tax=Thermosinus TaxID=261684 RepID=A1HME0_9FIRM|nr:hypothetical protein TcarDRAFT_2739 [Thermosinus carboxydivorans Nor1]